MPSATPPPDAGPGRLQEFLAALPSLDEAAVRTRAAELSAGPATGVDRLEAAIRLVDLTTLEGTDTPTRVRELCAAARGPDVDDPSCPAVAAVCVYSDLAPVAVEELRGSGVAVAAVAGSFPAGRAPLPVRVADVVFAVEAGADEVDVVLDRGAFLDGRVDQAQAQVRALREAAGDAHLKVILETAELPSLRDVQRASWLALLGGADMVKTSTGKGAAGATPAAVLVMLEAAAQFSEATGRPAGVKAAGGVRSADDALAYLALVSAVAGPDWLTPARFRFGASSLLGDLVRSRRAAQSGWQSG